MKRVLIANRGEIALRIVRACHEEGLEAVAVYSAADRSSPHVRAADRAVAIGPATPSQSYLNIERLVEAALERRAPMPCIPATASWPSEPPFAEAVERAGLTCVGPPPNAIRAMGDKTEARRRMQRGRRPDRAGRRARRWTSSGPALGLAREVGYPVMVKAAAGGGGKGMRVVRTPEELPGALESAAQRGAQGLRRRERVPREVHRAPAPRGDSGPRGRRRAPSISASASARSSGGTRSWSRRRRRPRSIAELREWMGAAAVAAAEAVGYRGAGTCEFLLAADRSFYFLEMNTRIQVEHPVTELVYGVDLVREQLRIAAGEPMRVPRAGSARGAGRSSAASPARIRPTGFCRAPAGSSTSGCPAAPASGGMRASTWATRSPSTTTRCWPS